MRSSIFAAGLAVAIANQALAGYTNVSEVPLYGLSPPVYPTPEGKGQTSAKWAEAYSKAAAFVAQLTLEEKVNVTGGTTEDICVGLTGGVPRLGFYGICFEDGPAGMRGANFVSAFPAGTHLASTWDKDYMYQYGKAYGNEYYGKGVNAALGPVGGPLGRVTRGGRQWEGPGPDPYITGVQMEQLVTGIQDAGIIAVSKVN